MLITQTSPCNDLYECVYKKVCSDSYFVVALIGFSGIRFVFSINKETNFKWKLVRFFGFDGAKHYMVFIE